MSLSRPGSFKKMVAQWVDLSDNPLSAGTVRHQIPREPRYLQPYLQLLLLID